MGGCGGNAKINIKIALVYISFYYYYFLDVNLFWAFVNLNFYLFFLHFDIFASREEQNHFFILILRSDVYCKMQI